MTEATEFTRVQNLISSGALTPDHYAADLSLSDPIVPALEFFLSLERIIGFSGKYAELINPVGTPDRNDRIVSWASLCAELGATYLLAQGLKAQIVGFNGVSRRAIRPESNCDIIAVANGHLLFVEVKRKASQDKQKLPETLETALCDLRLPCNICGVELLNRNYDCRNLDAEILKIKEHVEKSGRSGEPPGPFATDGFRISFGLGPNTSNISHLFDPAFSDDLAPYLLGPPQKRGMVPMVDQAREKGADYLFCRTPRWEEWPSIIEDCFEPVSFSNGHTYFIDDPRMHGLHGIVLFSGYNDFCVVNNINEGAGAWLVA
ncbi:MAG TPA: hypothetical protein VGJ94_06325 [Syntrophorhabdaceae bacterium]|jgi:hypothetical protein